MLLVYKRCMLDVFSSLCMALKVIIEMNDNCHFAIALYLALTSYF